MAMHLFKILIKLTMLGVVFAATTAPLVKPNCQSQCGNISIPYPFGTTDDCYLDKHFLITCDTTVIPSKPFLRNSSIGVLNISLEGTLRTSNYVSYDCYDSSGESPSKFENWVGLSAFFVSNTKNKFTAVGCDTFSVFRSLNGTKSRYGCLTSCENKDDVINGSCSGIGCCQTTIPKGIWGYAIDFYSNFNHTYVWKFNPCSYAFVAEDGAFNFSSLDLKNLRNIKEFPVVLDWAVGNQTCDEAKNNQTSYACKENSYCTNSENGPGYRCSCLGGFQGNPYLTNGCQDIDECETLRPCNGMCYNLPGSYNCSCPVGFKGDGIKNGTGCSPIFIAKHQSKGLFILGICTGVVGLLFLCVGAWWLYKVIKKRKDIKLKQKFFKQNGGLLLQQQFSSGEVNVDKIKMFNSKELEKATDHFNVDRMLGQGGQGTVYKGMLTDGRIVAVKKSKVIDEGKAEQFINEIVILSQIIHRNVVKLLGCCLETEVPLLVYEFIPNGTLFQYLHEQNEEFPLTWDVRLRIATEVAGALSYLHYAASLPIYHRDIKSSNILLDDKYRAKVADFGTSRSVAIDQTHATTIMVQGTFGYLDPEYYQSSQFTEKSDVYSFGVVLVELLTGQKPIFSTGTQKAKSLATYFILLMEENRLFDILDAQVMKEDRNEEVMVVAKLAKRCLNLNGKKRPTMKEVTMELERIQKSQKDFNDSQIYEEVEYVRTEITEPWDVASTSTGSGLDSGIASSFDTKRLLSTK